MNEQEKTMAVKQSFGQIIRQKQLINASRKINAKAGNIATS